MSSSYYWTPEEDTLLKTLCAQGLSYVKMSPHLGNRSKPAIARRAYLIGVKSAAKNEPKYNFDRAYFDTLTPESCYWAGIMQTDGHVNQHRGSMLLQWGCASRDRHHIELFKTATKAEQPIKDILKKCQLSTSDTEKGHPFSYIVFQSAKPWTDALERHYGITINKTLRSKMPNIPTTLLKLCFMRGMMDGDGFVTVGTQNKSATLGICGANREVIQWFKEVVDSLKLPTLATRSVNLMQPEGESCYYYRVNGLTASILFELFRRLPAPGLARKWEDPRLLEISAYWKSRADLWPPEVFFENILAS